MKKDLIKSFKKATKKIKEKEDKPTLKVCIYCKKASNDWIQSIAFENGLQIPDLTYVICGKCQEKRNEKRKKATS